MHEPLFLSMSQIYSLIKNFIYAYNYNYISNSSPLDKMIQLVVFTLFQGRGSI